MNLSFKTNERGWNISVEDKDNSHFSKAWRQNNEMKRMRGLPIPRRKRRQGTKLGV
jgi:hypothetical protein